MATALSVGVILPLTVAGSLWALLDCHPLSACFAAALLPIINDAPPAGQLQQGYQYNYGLGWGATLSGGHGLWTQPFAAAALITSLALACKVFSPKARSALTPPMQLVSWWRLAGAAWTGLLVGCCILCNVLFGYMAGVAVAVAGGLATVDALVASATRCLHRRRGPRNYPGSRPDPSTPEVDDGGDSVDPAGTLGIDFYPGVDVDHPCVPVCLLGVAGVFGLLASAHFLLPHLASAASISNYEARDYKIEGEGLPQALTVLCQGNLLDFGWNLNGDNSSSIGGGGSDATWDTLAPEEGLSWAHTSLFQCFVAAAKFAPRLPVITILLATGCILVLSRALVDRTRGTMDLVGEEAPSRYGAFVPQTQAYSLAARACALLTAIFTIMYGGYGGSRVVGGNFSAGLLDPSRIAPLLAWMVTRLPMVKSLHLHRFLAGVHAVALLLAPVSVEALASALGTVTAAALSPAAGAVSCRSSGGPHTRSSTRTSEWARCVAVVGLLWLLLPQYLRRASWALRTESVGRLARARAMGLVVAPATSELPSHSSMPKGCSAQLSTHSDAIDDLLNTLRGLPPGRVWAGDRSTTHAAFAMPESSSNRHFGGGVLVDDHLFVHLMQRGGEIGVQCQRFAEQKQSAAAPYRGAALKNCGSVDVAGPLLHGLSKPADLLPEVDFSRSAYQRRVFGVAYVALPSAFLAPRGRMPLPTGMVEINLNETGSTLSLSGATSDNSDGMCTEWSNPWSQQTSPFRLFADESMVGPVLPRAEPPSAQSSFSYFTLARVLAPPLASEHVLSAGDLFQLSSQTAAFLRPASASDWTHDNSEELVFTNCSKEEGRGFAARVVAAFKPALLSLAAVPSLAPVVCSVLVFAGLPTWAEAMTTFVADVSAGRPATAAAVRQLGQGWLLGLASAKERGRSEVGAPIPFFLGWPTTSALDKVVSASTTGGAANRRHGETRLRWGVALSRQVPPPQTASDVDSAVHAHLISEVAAPGLDRFSCDVRVKPSGAAAAATEAASAAGGTDSTSSASANLRARVVADASVVLRVSFHPGWKCTVAVLGQAGGMLSVDPVPVPVGEVVPGFPFVDLFAHRLISDSPSTMCSGSDVGSNACDGGDKEWAVQRVECAYNPSELKGALLLMALASSIAAVIGLLGAAFAHLR